SYQLTSVIGQGCSAGSLGNTVVITPQPGPAATLSGTQTVCIGQSAQLTVTYSRTPFDFSYSDGTTLQTLTNIGVSPYVFTLTPNSNTSYQLTSVIGQGCSAGSLGSPVVITQQLGPAATVYGTQTICPGQGVQLSINYPLIPFDFSYSDGTTVQTLTHITTSPYLWSLTPTTTTTYTLTQVIGQGCSAGSMGSPVVITHQSGPVATLSGTQTLCPGQATQLTVSYAYTPFDFTYSDGTTVQTLTNIGVSPYVFTVTPNSNTTYQLTSVYGQGCFSGSLGSHLVTLQQVPSASVAPAQTLCAGQPAVLSVFNSTALPWSFNYSDGVNNFPVTGVTNSPYLVNITPFSATTYTFSNISNTCGVSAFNLQTQVQVYAPQAVLTATQTICRGQIAQLTFQCSGTPPWQITYHDGTSSHTITGITNSPFLLDLTPSDNTTYTLESVVTSGCAATLPPPQQAPVVVFRGQVANLYSPAPICAGATAQLTLDFSGISPLGWSFLYSDGSNSFPLTPTSASPVLFTVNPGITTTYTILQAQWYNCQAALPHSSAVVTRWAVPTITLTGNQVIPSGTPATLTITATGTPPWAFTWTDGTQSVLEPNILSSPFLLSVTPTSQTTYSIVSGQDSLCSATVQGSAIVDISNNRFYDLDKSPFVIYPNPTQGWVTIASSVLMKFNSIKLFQMDGRILKDWRPESETKNYTFDCTSLSSGIYLIEITDDNNEIYYHKLELIGK
ncbi:MAG: T9SS C-terminal target domain-containing protein, partial [Sphingobacteriia bacterium]|nr:T9SS C-terminal target domain-containing protein [Sphingobacteriia bacterium]